MPAYILSGKSYQVTYSPEDLFLSVKIGDKSWEWNKSKILIKFKNSDMKNINGDFSSNAAFFITASVSFADSRLFK